VSVRAVLIFLKFLATSDARDIAAGETLHRELQTNYHWCFGIEAAMRELRMIGVAVTLLVPLESKFAQAAQVPADQADEARRKGIPDWQARGLRCNPKTWISVAAWEKKCHRPGNNQFKWVCPACN